MKKKLSQGVRDIGLSDENLSMYLKCIINITDEFY